MGARQRFGIKYPFELNNLENLFVDVNNTYEDAIKSKLLHVLFTPKGQRIRDPEFGTNLTKFIFQPSDSDTFSQLKLQLKSDLKKYVPEVDFEDITIADDSNNENSKIIIIHYSMDNGGEKTITSVGIKI